MNNFLLELHKKLEIPFDKNFYNLPLSHYEKLVESKGLPKVNSYIRELIIFLHDPMLAEKARILKRKLNKKLLSEAVKTEDECECGFMFMGEDYKDCPICGKELYKDKVCYWKDNKGKCSIDEEECKWANEKECGKLD